MTWPSAGSRLCFLFGSFFPLFFALWVPRFGGEPVVNARVSALHNLSVVFYSKGLRSIDIVASDSISNSNNAVASTNFIDHKEKKQLGFGTR